MDTTILPKMWQRKLELYSFGGLKASRLRATWCIILLIGVFELKSISRADSYSNLRQGYEERTAGSIR